MMASGLSFFLGVRPGELLYSALARHSEALGSVGPKAVMSALFGRANAVATMDLPTNLGALVERLPLSVGMDGETLAWNHTLLPYYIRFQHPDVAARALRTMVHSGGSIHLTLGIPTFRTGRPTHLQFCKSCANGMLEEFGTLHWRCVHQLPGVLVCPDHAEPLRRSSVSLVMTNRHEFVPASAQTCDPDSEPVAMALNEDEMVGALAIAQASAALLCRPTRFRGGPELQTGYRHALYTAGLGKGRFKVNQVELKRRFKAHWGDLLHRFEGVRFAGCQETWLASLVRPSKSAQPPLQHLLLRLFLHAQPEVPPTPVRINAPRHRLKNITKVKPVAEPRLDWRAIDVRYARKLREGAAFIYLMEPPTRATLGGIERLLGRRDWLSKRKSKLPLSCAAAQTICEEVSAFQARRLKWYAGQCRAENVSDPWILIRRAGLKGAMINAAKVELGRHRDET